MPDHRIRLTDEALELIVSALYARTTGVGAERRVKLRRLAERLAECAPGNPHLRFDWDEQAVAKAVWAGAGSSPDKCGVTEAAGA